MTSRVYITAPEMLPALQEYENFIQGDASPFLKKLFFLFGACDHANLRKLAEVYAPQVFAYCCFTWRIDPCSLFTRDPRFAAARRIPTHKFQSAKELPLFTDDLLNSKYGGMIQDKMFFYNGK